MAFDAYVIFDKPVVKGESSASGDRIKEMSGKFPMEALSYKFGTKMAVTESQSGAGSKTTGRGQFDVFEFEKNVDSATTQLAKLTALGTVFANVWLHLYFTTTDSGTQKQVHVVSIEMRKAVISNCTISAGGGDEPPKETVEINYGEIHFKYQALKADGSGAASGNWTEYQWSALTNTKNLT